MSQSRGKARRADKQKKRRTGRQKERAERRQHRPAEAPTANLVAPTQSSSSRPSAAALAAEQLLAIGYDPIVGPDPNGWRALPDTERLQRIERYHQHALALDARPPNPMRHAAMHLIVEDQLAAKDPPEMQHALAQLIADGMHRHDAVHALGWLIMDYLKRARDNPAELDTAGYRADLKQLTLKRWLAMAASGSSAPS